MAHTSSKTRMFIESWVKLRCHLCQVKRLMHQYLAVQRGLPHLYYLVVEHIKLPLPGISRQRANNGQWDDLKAASINLTCMMLLQAGPSTY